MNSRDGQKPFLPLFEALNWAVSMDDHVAVHWSPHGTPLGPAWRTHVQDSGIVSAVRLARNRVHHQWADALEFRDGRAYPIVYPKVYGEWSWRNLDELPASNRTTRYGVAEYIEVLQGRPARFALHDLGGLYEQLVEILEPELPTG